MRATTKRFLALVAAIAVFGYAAHLALNVSGELWKQVNALKTEQSERLGVLQQLGDLVSRANDLIARYEDLDRRARPIAAALPLEPRTPEVLAIVYALSQQHSLSLSQISFQEEFRQPQERRRQSGAARSSSVALKAELKLAGTYADFKNWLKSVESELRLMDAIAISAQKISPKPEDPVMSFDVTLLAYWQSSVEAIAIGGEPL